MAVPGNSAGGLWISTKAHCRDHHPRRLL